MHISTAISDMFIVTGYDACEKTAFGQVRTVSRGIGIPNWIFSTPWFAWRGRQLTMEKYRRPRPASKTGNLGFPRLDRALRIFAYREMFNFRWQKAAGYL